MATPPSDQLHGKYHANITNQMGLCTYYGRGEMISTAPNGPQTKLAETFAKFLPSHVESQGAHHDTTEIRNGTRSRGEVLQASLGRDWNSVRGGKKVGLYHMWRGSSNAQSLL